MAHRGSDERYAAAIDSLPAGSESQRQTKSFRINYVNIVAPWVWENILQPAVRLGTSQRVHLR